MSRSSTNTGVSVNYSLQGKHDSNCFKFRLYFYSTASKLVKNFLYGEDINHLNEHYLRASVRLNSDCDLVITKDDLGFQFSNARIIQSIVPDRINMHVLPGQDKDFTVVIDESKFSFWGDGKQYTPEDILDFPDKLRNLKHKSVFIDFDIIKQHIMFNYSEKKGNGRPRYRTRKNTPEIAPSPVKVIKSVDTLVPLQSNKSDERVVTKRVDNCLFVYYPDKIVDNLYVLNLIDREIRKASSIEQFYFKTLT